MSSFVIEKPSYHYEKSKSWFYESAAEKAHIAVDQNKSTFAPELNGEKSFDDHFKELAIAYDERAGIDIKKDLGKMLADKTFMEAYKMDLMEPVIEGFKAASPGDPHIQSIINNVNTFWDTKVRTFTESATMTGFLPIATLEFPVLVKQFFQTIMKDIIEVEAVKTPMISRHICTRYLVDNQTGQEYEYPKCMFNGDWQHILRASKGIEIYHQVMLPQHQYDLIDHIRQAHARANDGVTIDDVSRLTFQLMISKIIVQDGTQTGVPRLDDQGQPVLDDQTNQPIVDQVATEIEVDIPGNGIRIEFSTGGTFLNGDLHFTTRINGQDKLVDTTIGGQVHYKTGMVDISSSNMADPTATTVKVVGVIFQGFISNEANLRSVSVREERSVLRFTIEDGPRWNMPFSIEEIEDAAALLDLNYYNRMVDEIVRTQEQIETMTVIKFLNDQFNKFNGVQTDIYKLESVAMDYQVDLQPPAGFAGDPFKYISSVIQFRLKAIIHDLTDLLKLDNLSFIIVGNPMAVQPICEFVNWKCQQGQSIGGITVNGSYGFATDMGANIRVVSSNLYSPYTADNVVQNAGQADEKSQPELVLHMYGYPTSPDHISYRHLKYTSHLLTSQSQTAYTSPKISRGGAYNIVTATSRYHTFAVQGIQARIVLLNSDRIYGLQGDRANVGAPWRDKFHLEGVPYPTSDAQ